MTEPIVRNGEVVEGRYKIIRPIAAGGMGTVFLAEHWLIKRKVAIKILHPELAGDAQMIRRFMNEALAAGTLGHPNIVESTDMGFTKTDLPYIVFEYLEGVSIADEVARLGRIQVARALHIARQIASALDAAHAAGIVHRDLKTENILLVERDGARDHVKVLDFGISLFLAASDRTQQGLGSVLGTPEFISPEQVLAPATVDRRADIWALGIVLFEMLGGHVPFEVVGAATDLDATHALIGRVINDPPPPLACAEAPAGLEQMIATKLLAKNRDHRFSNMKEVQAELDAFLDGLPGAARPPASAAGLDGISDKTVSRTLLAPAEIAREVRQLGGRWSLDDGDLVLELYSPYMVKLASVIASAAAIADEMEHHPVIHFEPRHLRLTLPSAETVVDFVYAARLEQWLREHYW